MMDAETFGKELATVVKAAMAKAQLPIEARLAAIEARLDAIEAAGDRPKGTQGKRK